jgi:hypothetical protein
MSSASIAKFPNKGILKTKRNPVTLKNMMGTQIQWIITF